MPFRLLINQKYSHQYWVAVFLILPNLTNLFSTTQSIFMEFWLQHNKFDNIRWLKARISQITQQCFGTAARRTIRGYLLHQHSQSFLYVLHGFLMRYYTTIFHIIDPFIQLHEESFFQDCENINLLG